MIYQCPNLSEFYMENNNKMEGLYKGAYWKSLPPNLLEAEETLAPTPGCTFLRRRRHGRLVGPRLAPGRFYRPGRHL